MVTDKVTNYNIEARYPETRMPYIGNFPNKPVGRLLMKPNN